MDLDYDLLTQRARIDTRQAAAALDALATGTAGWLVVGGKMTAGKDTVAPELQGLFDDVAMLRYGNLMRADLDPGLAVLRDDVTAGVDPACTATKVAAVMNLALPYADELVRVLTPEVIASDGTLTPLSRTDGIRFVLQSLGDHWRCQDDEDYWARAAAQASLVEVGQGRSVILTGGRFLPDVDLPRAAGSILIRLEVSRETQLRRLSSRDGLAPSAETLAALDHPSETALDDYPHFDVCVDNDVDGDEHLARVIERVQDGVRANLQRRQTIAA